MGQAKQIKPFDNEVEEEWVRDISYNSPGGAGATKIKDEDVWQVIVDAAEFVREEPLVSELQTCIREALLTVAGVTRVEHEDTETWHVEGTPSGADLVNAVGAALDVLDAKLRAHMESLGAT